MAEHQKPAQLPIKRPDPTQQLASRFALGLALFTFLSLSAGEVLFGLILGAMAIFFGWYGNPGLISRYLAPLVPASDKPGTAAGPRSLADLQRAAARAGGGAYLGNNKQGQPIFAPPTAAVLVLAGPRAGKTSCIVIPALAAHPGPAVATSTKREVLRATLPARRRLGKAWFFDLEGHGAPPDTIALHWSPVTRAADWQQAQLVADAMTGATTVDADGAHWMERAGALIACTLHAASRSGQNMRQVLGWILRHDTDSPLEELAPDTIAADVLQGIKHSSDRERASIFSTAARVLKAYRSEIALAASENPNFDPDTFVAGRDTVYIAAPAHEQALLAPLVVGLLTEIRQVAYRRHQEHGPSAAPVQFMLDECANIAPLPDLPPMLSEAGGQGVQAISVFQDMSQARRRWHADADGMLSLYGARAILAGIADTKTLEQISLLCGDWDRPIQSITHTAPTTPTGTRESTYGESWTTKRQRRLPPDEIAQIPQGQALIMIGARWELVPTTPDHDHPAFTTPQTPPTTT